MRPQNKILESLSSNIAQGTVNKDSAWYNLIASFLYLFLEVLIDFREIYCSKK